MADTAPIHELSEEWGWGRTCKSCGRRLKPEEGPYCKRDGCVLRYAVPNLAPTRVNFGADGPRETSA